MITTHDRNLLNEIKNLSSADVNFKKYETNERKGMFYLLTAGKYWLLIIKKDMRTYPYSGMYIKVLGWK